MKKNIISTVICAVLSVCLGIGVFASVSKLAASKTSGEYIQRIENRVNFTIKNTSFTFKEVKNGDYLTLNISFEAEKTEPDFYCRINSIDFEGCSYKTMTLINAKNNRPFMSDSGYVFETAPLKLNVEIAVPSDIPSQGCFLTVDYTSGMTEKTSDEHILRIPVTVEK